jgi:predicted ATP-grasp superfamily ATP-dependent carboligase
MSNHVVSPTRDGSDVLITQGWGRTAYQIVRSLGKHGLKVVLGTDKFGGMASFSRYASARFRHPIITLETTEFVQSVKAALHRYTPKVYLPTGEDTYVVAKFVDELQKTGVTIPIAPFQTLKALHKKDEAISLAKLIGIPVPATTVPKSHDEISSFFKEFGSPIVLKRISSSGARGVFYLTQNQLDDADRHQSLISDLPFGEFVLQEYVRGVGMGVSMLFNHGKLRARFTHRRLREKTASGGISTLRVGVVNAMLEEYAQRLLEHVEFHGVAMVEFKYDERTGKGWLIEVNPRLWGSLALAIQSGVDFPYLIYRMAIEGDIDPVLDYQSGLVARWIVGDVWAMVCQRRLSSLTVSRADGFDDLCWDDPLPFFGGALLALSKSLRMRKWLPCDVDLDIDRVDRM